jgi:hypothetical protein
MGGASGSIEVVVVRGADEVTLKATFEGGSLDHGPLTGNGRPN